MRAVHCGAVLALAASLSGCVTHPRQPFAEASRPAIRKIAILPVSPDPQRYEINVIRNGAAVFGLLGGLVLLSELNARTDRISEAGRRYGTPDIGALIARELERRLTRAGYAAVRMETVRQKLKMQPDLSTLPFPTKAEADAVLVISMQTVGFWAESVNTAYRPEIRVVAALAETDTRKMIYAETFTYGVDYLGSDAIQIEPEPKYSYADFKSLERNTRRAFEGLRKGASVIASRVAVALAPPGTTAALLDDPAPEPARYPQTLGAPEMVAHFRRNTEIHANPGRLAFTLTILPDGSVKRVCEQCPVPVGFGTMTPKMDEGRVCFAWEKITYPRAGCFALVQTAPRRFELRGDAGERVMRYSVEADDL